MFHKKLLYLLVTGLIGVYAPFLVEIVQLILLLEFQLVFPKEVPDNITQLLESKAIATKKKKNKNKKKNVYKDKPK